MRTWIGLLVVLVTSGCAVGNKHTYAGTAQLAVQGSRSVAVATEDVRPYVVSKEKTPDFVGLQRGGFGNPFDVRTESGKPLSDDFSATIARSLEGKGFKATVVAVAPGAPVPEPRSLVAKAGAERLALVTLDEWRSDTFMNVGLSYSMTLRVFDASGQELARNRVTGNDNLGGSAWNPPAHARTAIPAAFQKKIEELFAVEAVARSLR